MNKIVFLFFLSLLGYSNLAVASTQANTSQIQTEAISQNNQRSFLGQLEKHSKKVIGMVVSVILIGGVAILLFLKRNNDNKPLGGPNGRESKNIQGRTEELLNSNHGNTQLDTPAESVDSEGGSEINTNNTLNREVLKNLTREQEDSGVNINSPTENDSKESLSNGGYQNIQANNNRRGSTDNQETSNNNTDQTNILNDLPNHDNQSGEVTNLLDAIGNNQKDMINMINIINNTNENDVNQTLNNTKKQSSQAGSTSDTTTNQVTIEDLEKKIGDRVYNYMYTNHSRTIDDERGWLNEQFQLIESTFGIEKVKSFLKTPKKGRATSFKILLESPIDGSDFQFFKLIDTYYKKYNITPVIDGKVMDRLVHNIFFDSTKKDKNKNRLDILNFLIKEKNESVLKYLKSPKERFGLNLKVDGKSPNIKSEESFLIAAAYKSREHLFDIAWDNGNTSQKNNLYLIAACLDAYRRAVKSKITEAKNILTKVIQAQERGSFSNIKFGNKKKHALEVIFAKKDGSIDKDVVRILLDKMDVKEIACIDGIATIYSSNDSSGDSKQNEGYLRSQLEKIAESDKQKAEDLYNTIYDVYYQRIAKKIKRRSQQINLPSEEYVKKLVIFVDSVTERTADIKIDSPILAQIKRLGPKNNLSSQVDDLPTVEGSNVNEKAVQEILCKMILEDLGTILVNISENRLKKGVAVLHFLLDRIIDNIPTPEITDKVLESFEKEGSNFFQELEKLYVSLKKRVKKQKELLQQFKDR